MIKVKMLTSMIGTANCHGSETRVYNAGEELMASEWWEISLAETFVSLGAACYADEERVEEVKETPKRRSRAKKVS